MMLATSLNARWCAVTSAVLLLAQPLAAFPLRILAWNEEIAARKLAIVDAKGSMPVDAMHPAKRTKTYQVTTAGKPAWIQALDKTDKEGKPTASEIKIPEGTKHPLLLLLPDDRAATGLRLFVLDDDAANFPWGSFRFINASGKKLAFVFEKNAVTLPASWEPVLANPGGNNRNLEAQIFFFDQPASPVYSAVWEHQQDVRTLVFLVPGEDPRLGPVALKMIPEDRRVKEPPPAAAGNR